MSDLVREALRLYMEEWEWRWTASGVLAVSKVATRRNCAAETMAGKARSTRMGEA